MSPRYSYFLNYTLFFFSDEGDEPVHIHVAERGSPDNSSKFWVSENKVELVHNHAGLPEHILKKVETYIAVNAIDIINFWNKHFER